MQDDLKERLRRSVKKPYSAKRGPPPCEPQMLDRIAALEAENERLRGALRLIIENESADTGYGNSSAKIARAALKESQQ